MASVHSERKDVCQRKEFSRAVEREEEKVMASLRKKITDHGWTVGSLIHDAIVVNKGDTLHEREKLYEAVDNALEEISDEKGLGRGLIKFTMAKT